MMKTLEKISAKVYMFLIYLFLYAPILALIVFSFNSSKSMASWEGFTLKWYQALLDNDKILKALYNTLLVALSSSIISTIVGTIAAIGIYNMRGKTKKLILNINYLPVLNPDIVTGIALMSLFVFLHLTFGFKTLMLAHITFNIPYVILSVLPKLKQMPSNITEAALDLGATPSYAMRKIIIPQITPGIISGFIMAFTMSIDDFVISFFTTGSGVSNLSIEIFSMARRGIKPEINALSTLMFITVLTLLILVNKKDLSKEPVKKNKPSSNKNGNRAMAFALVIILLVTSFAIYGKKKSDRKVLNVFNVGDYIDKELITKFQDETGIKVNYEEYDTNEIMYQKLKGGNSSYDIVVPSDYMLQKMIKEDMVEKLDFNNIPNYKNIDDKFKNLSYDPKNEYSVPYMWGTVGIIYNKTMVTDPVDSWNILWNPKYSKQIMMFDSIRDTMAISLKRLGYSINTTDPKEINEAKEELIKQKPLVKAYVVDEVKDRMIGGEAALATVWSGDAVYMMEQNPDLEYVVPKEGSNKWFDTLVVPKDSPHKEEAEAFINFLCDPQNAKQNVEYIGYSTPNKEAFKLLDEDTQNNPASYPSDELLDKCEVFVDLGDSLKLYDDAWLEIKSN
ncbi:extracellular solute-binding protein [Clostridium paridis]|uniref:Extracellular solute-binding protein n=1 Tax=Clostridium paridis TaxID=2803863 RepID=A0A937K554_9CLOT|nr:extracellular solute-binding protein [Clostridium paridis]MBL4932203.1 extracellular solute-binding protein [Clostridium paridis]